MRMNSCEAGLGKAMGGLGIKKFKEASKLKKGGCGCSKMDDQTKAAFGLSDYDAYLCKAPLPPGQVAVHIGSSKKNTKTVTPSTPVSSCTSPCGKGCRLNEHDAGDNFEVTVQNGQVTARRLDSNGGWGMDLKVPCQAS